MRSPITSFLHRASVLAPHYDLLASVASNTYQSVELIQGTTAISVLEDAVIGYLMWELSCISYQCDEPICRIGLRISIAQLEILVNR